MADTQWFRKSNGQEFEEAVGTPTYNRLVADGEYVAIDAEGGDEVELETPEEETEETPETAEEPFAGYDDATVEELIPQLEECDDEQLAAVEAYEVANKNRKGVLEAIESIREERSAPPEE